MTTRYVDPAASGADDGTSWGDAYETIQQAFDAVAAGDLVYCRGTETLGSIVDVDFADGDATSGLVRFIGCNAGGTNDGTRFIMDGNSAVANCLKITARDYYLMENFEFKNATGAGMYFASSSHSWIFNNCCANNNGSYGFFIGGNGLRNIFIRCASYSNSNDGFFLGASDRVFFSSSHDNTESGFQLGQAAAAMVVGCLAYDNGNDGMEEVQYPSTIIGSTINGNTDNAITVKTSGTILIPAIIGNRVTNHSGAGDLGIDFSTEVVMHGWNYLEDNDTNYANTSLAYEILNDGATTNEEDQADTNEGYTSLTDGSEDFNLRSDATLRRTAISIPLT